MFSMTDNKTGSFSDRTRKPRLPSTFHNRAGAWIEIIFYILMKRKEALGIVDVYCIYPYRNVGECGHSISDLSLHINLCINALIYVHFHRFDREMLISSSALLKSSYDMLNFKNINQPSHCGTFFLTLGLINNSIYS